MDSVSLVYFTRPYTLSFPAAAAAIFPAKFSNGEDVWRSGCKGPSSSSNVTIKASSNKEFSVLKSYFVSRLQRYFTIHQYRNDDDESGLFKPRFQNFIVNVDSGHPLESEPESYDLNDAYDSEKKPLDAFYRFSRPHTVLGTALSIVSVSLLAVEKVSDFSPLFCAGVFKALVAALCMNIYIVGLNQLTDIEIDKVNKPYLPLASGEFSIGTGVVIVALFSILSFVISWIIGSGPLFWAIFLSFVLGTAYSINLPLLRWKRFAFVAAMCIVAVRAVIVQLAFYLHMQIFVYGRPVIFSRSLLFAVAFMSFFSVVIALFKDIPDIDGDRIFGIRSFTVRFGQKWVFWACITLLELGYSIAILVGLSSSRLWSKMITVCGHATLGVILWDKAKSMDWENKSAITSCYMFIWKLFYAEYLLIPLVR